MDVQPVIDATTGRPVERHVGAVEWESPGRQAVHHSRGDVAGDGAGAELGQAACSSSA